MTLTREQYDILVLKFPYFMGTRWPKYRKKWSINGVRVIGNDTMLAELSSFLKRG